MIRWILLALVGVFLGNIFLNVVPRFFDVCHFAYPSKESREESHRIQAALIYHALGAMGDKVETKIPVREIVPNATKLCASPSLIDDWPVAEKELNFRLEYKACCYWQSRKGGVHLVFRTPNLTIPVFFNKYWLPKALSDYRKPCMQISDNTLFVFRTTHSIIGFELTEEN